MSRTTTIFYLLTTIAFSALSAQPVWAQKVPLVEIGPIFSSTPFFISSPFNARGFGIGGRVVVNPHRILAGELQVSTLPWLDNVEGSGATAIAHLKVTARLEDRAKFNVFALAGPGWLREHTACCGGHVVQDSRDSFVWDIGGGIEFVPARRVTVRTDFTDIIQTRTFTSVPSDHFHGFNFSAGVHYRWK